MLTVNKNIEIIQILNNLNECLTFLSYEQQIKKN